MTSHDAGSTAASELSRGVLTFLQKESASSPQAKDDAVRAIAATTPSETLVEQVRVVVSECLAVPVDWSSLSLGDAGRAAAAETGRRHPELDQPALDALAWNFSFTWR